METIYSALQPTFNLPSLAVILYFAIGLACAHIVRRNLHGTDDAPSLSAYFWLVLLWPIPTAMGVYNGVHELCKKGANAPPSDKPAFRVEGYRRAHLGEFPTVIVPDFCAGRELVITSTSPLTALQAADLRVLQKYLPAALSHFSYDDFRCGNAREVAEKAAFALTRSFAAIWFGVYGGKILMNVEFSNPVGSFVKGDGYQPEKVIKFADIPKSSRAPFVHVEIDKNLERPEVRINGEVVSMFDVPDKQPPEDLSPENLALLAKFKLNLYNALVDKFGKDSGNKPTPESMKEFLSKWMQENVPMPEVPAPIIEVRREGNEVTVDIDFPAGFAKP